MSKDKTKREKELSAAELSTFCGQVALILEGSLSLYDGMEILAGADTTSDNAGVYQAANRGYAETGSLYEALKNDSRWPRYLVEMVGIGERSGELENVMRGLEAYYAREDRIRNSLINAVTYPLVLGGMLVVIVWILLWKVLPVFRRVLESMGVGINESGVLLMRVGTIVGWAVLILVVVLAVSVLAVILLLRTGYKDKVLAAVRKLFPAADQLNRGLSASRVAGVLSMMFHGGIPTDDALEMTAGVLDDQEASEKVQKIRTGLDEGKTFANAVCETKLFSELHNRMIQMGSAAGREERVFGKLAELYEKQVEDDIIRLVSIIEPSLVALLSVVIGAVLLSVMLPMAGILSSL